MSKEKPFKLTSSDGATAHAVRAHDPANMHFILGEPHRRYKTHAETYPVFASRLEGIIQPSVDVYITDVAKDRKEEEKQERGQNG